MRSTGSRKSSKTWAEIERWISYGYHPDEIQIQLDEELNPNASRLLDTVSTPTEIKLATNEFQKRKGDWDAAKGWSPSP